MGTAHQHFFFYRNLFADFLRVNYSPQSIEEAIEEAVPGLTANFTVAFPHRPAGSETEVVCIVYLTTNNPSDDVKRAETTAAISKAVVKYFGVRPYRIIPLPDSSLLPKSSLGKLSRSKIRSSFEVSFPERNFPISW